MPRSRSVWRPPESKSLRKFVEGTLSGAKSSTRCILDMGVGMIKMLRSEDNMYKTTLATPKTILNVRVTQQRRIAPLSIELARFKAIGKKVGVTVNDIVLGIVAGSVRRYLLELDALPEKSLTASCPIVQCALDIFRK